MSFPKYEAYKDSEVEWLGEVPEHWDALTLRRVVSAVKTGGTPSQEQPSKEISDGTEWYTPGDFDGNLILSSSEKRVSSSAIRTGEAKVFPAGSILVVGIGATLGKVAFLKQAASANQQINAIIPTSKIDGYFLAYSLSVKVEAMRYLASAATIGIMNQDKTKELWITLPPISEQYLITRFLDHETARIDALIAEQQRLIELLKEKRQAVISHAVTKGLDPTAPMKDSCVEWLGEVPAHWKVVRVKHVIQSFEQGWSPQCDNVPIENDEEWGVLKVGCVNGGIFSLTENKRLPDNLEPIPALSLKAGDVLISRANTRELVGNAALVDLDQPNLMLSDKLFRLRTTGDMLPKYLVFYLGTSAVRYQIELDATGASSSMFNIGQAIIKELPIPVPSVTEQQDIVTKLEASLNDLYLLQKEAQLTQKLLHERRSALISAAVTGKIDVRGWHAPASTSPAPTLEPVHVRQ